jgi:hypothetical protein
MEWQYTWNLKLSSGRVGKNKNVDKNEEFQSQPEEIYYSILFFFWMLQCHDKKFHFVFLKVFLELGVQW